MELNVCVVKRGNWISDGSFYYNISYSFHLKPATSLKFDIFIGFYRKF